ncbi:hypothetical protein Taro_022170, partial [Colocasia esculenta]|nr:hypothetical protein [Colocasia esculenta]
ILTLFMPRRPAQVCQRSSPSEQGNTECKAETLRGLLKLFSIWTSCLTYDFMFAQTSTLFTKQGSTMDKRITPTFLVLPAALQSSINISIFAFLPIYDRVIVPMARTFTGTSSDVTTLQTIGIRMFLSVVTMVASTIIETRRLQTARDFGLVDLPKATVPMSLWWLLPQYVLCRISDVFAVVGLQEFFYDQVPDGLSVRIGYSNPTLRSLGMALFLSIFGIGSFISTFLVTVIDKVSSRSGESWFSDNLNRAHLDYFYWLLAGLCAVQLLISL